MIHNLATALMAFSLTMIPSLLAIAPASAQSAAPKPSTQCVRTPEMIGPVTLVQIAYQGALEKQGIPSAQGLLSAYSQGSITLPQIVNAAVKACILSAKYNFATNEGYLGDMKLELDGMLGGGR